MKVRVAMFECVKWGGFIPAGHAEGNEKDSFGNGEYVRATEYVDVEFPALGRSEVVKAQLDALDLEEEKARKESACKLALIDNRRRSLLALTHDTEAA